MSRVRTRRPGALPARITPYLIAIAIACAFAVTAGVAIRLFLAQPAAIVIEVVPIQDDGRLQVQVAGEVPHPGVYHLAPGSTVGDAIDASGGDVASAGLDDSRAQVSLDDGAFLFVPTEQASQSPDGSIDLNTASAEDLESLPGIGPVIAARIVQYRQENGPFPTVDSLTNVSGVSARMVAEMRDLITVSAD